MKKYEKYIVKQLDFTDCGAACLLMLVKFHGGNNSIDNMRSLSGTSLDGTTLLGLYQAANKLGFKAEGCEADLRSLKDHGQPLILHITTHNIEHFVILFEYDSTSNQFIIGDPELGMEVYSEKELLEKWKSRTCLIADKNADFHQINTLVNDNKRKLKWIFSFIKADTSLLILSACMGILIAVTGLSTSVFSQYMIDNLLSANLESKLIYSVLLLSIVLLLNSVLTYIRGILSYIQKKDFNIRINSYFLKELMNLPLAFFKTRKSGDFVSRLNDGFKIQNFIEHLVTTMVIDTLIIVFSLAVLFHYSPVIGFISVAIMPLYIIVMILANKKLMKFQKQVMISYSNTESNFIGIIKGIDTIRLFGKDDSFVEKTENAIADFQQNDYSLRTSALSVNFKWSMINNVFLGIVIMIAGSFVFAGTIKLGAFIAIMGILAYFLPSISRLAMIIIPLNESKVAFDRMLEYTNSDKETVGGIAIGSYENLTISNLDFRYTGKPILLKNISLEINKNEIVAIVGESGCGKSTIVSLLQRIFDHERGEIKINNRLLPEYDLKSLRNSIGIISQEPSFFSGTVIDNIIMDNYTIEERISLINFLKDLGIDHYIQKMDQGYDTIVGEDGSNISGGQRQIISFARVLYKNPGFLILDEATSAMDRKTEKFFVELINRLKNEMPVLYITHRLDTLKNFADKIYVMEDGEITRYGSHQALLKTDNLYSQYHLAC